jgi:hypothetical protein
VITVVSTPSGSQFDAASGLWSWTPHEADGPGVFAVTLRADNGVMTSDRTFQVTVTETNRPPTMEPVPLQNVGVGQPWSFQLVASDPDLPANTLTFALVNAPAGATINAASGRVTWTPGSGHQGTTVVFQANVRDGLATTTIPLEIRVQQTAGAAYQAWVQSIFTPAQALDPSISGPVADPNKDGIPNLIEFVLGGNPATGQNPSLLPAMALVSNPGGTVPNGEYFRFTYRRVPAAASLNPGMEFSSSLAGTWTPATGAQGVVEVVTPNFYASPTAADRVEVHVPRATHTANGKFFGRLRVNSP